MLSSLSIQNVVLIDQLNIEFSRGLCALTGETGAGKSILLDSLGLALGARSDSGLVRKGALEAQVTALFNVERSHAAYKILQEAGFTGDEGDVPLILRRTVNKDGRSKAFINDQPVSAGLLKQVGAELLEIHGQFETQGLLDVSTHRRILDDYAGLDSKVQNFYALWQALEAELVELKEACEAARADEEFLRQAIEDLDGLNPNSGEEKELADLRERLMSKEQVLSALNEAYQMLNGESDPVRSAWGALDRVAEKMGAQGGQIIESLERASNEVEEAMSLIQTVSTDLQESEHSLETIDDRLFALRAQARKHGVGVDELAELRENLANRLSTIEHGDGMLAKKMKEVEEAKARYIKEAKHVHECRKDSAEKLDRLIAEELPPLKLDKARFVTSVEILDEAQWGGHGMDKVQFLVATNPGAVPGALGKIASGGELSRFMLALKVVMAEIGAAGCLVFDEVDAGVGGSTADAVGERLARLAEVKQILVVTHSPQVAARAAHHYIVHKDGAQELKTNIVHLKTRSDRSEEIARMLAGATITDEARAAANKLLQTG